MFLIRCSILNYVNADIEESQYYISQDIKVLPYYLTAFHKKNLILQDASGNIKDFVKDKVWLYNTFSRQFRAVKTHVYTEVVSN